MISKMQHPNVIRAYGIWKKTDQEVFMVLEFCVHGDIVAYINKPLSEVSSTQRQQWVLQVAEGMKFLHSRKDSVVHRDLKPENILLNEHLVAKIADFGISREAVTRRATTRASAAGTMGYIPPEAIRRDIGVQVSTAEFKKGDVYSFGVLMCYILSGTDPFAKMSEANIMYMVAMKNERPAIPAHVDKDPQNPVFK